MCSTCLVVTGTIVGGVTFYPVILRTIWGAGSFLKTFSEIKDYEKKSEMCKFAHATCEKVWVDLRASLRGAEFNGTLFFFEMKMIDDIIIDLCPLVDKFEKQYDNKFK